MPARPGTTLTPGNRVTVEIGYSRRAALRPLCGLLRTVEVTDDGRVLIYGEDGTREQFNGRAIPPVSLAEASIQSDPATGEMWARTYDVPPRDTGSYPLPVCDAAVAEPDGHGGIARMASCSCGRGCSCPQCGRQTITVARGIGWVESLLLDGGAHDCGWWNRTSCRGKDRGQCPECCAMPMMMAPAAWTCRRDSGHRRAYRWPEG